MKFVYLLRSLSHPGRRYVGLTDDLNDRLRRHNAGDVRSTSRYRPWELVLALRFENDARALEFEASAKAEEAPFYAFPARRSGFYSNGSRSSHQ